MPVTRGFGIVGAGVIAAARTAGVALTVISQHRFDAGLIELRRLIDAGALGRLVLGEASTKWYRQQAYYDSAAWRGSYAMDGGSPMNQGVHYVDLLRWCLGPPAEVTAVCTTQAYPGFPQRLEVTGTAGTVIVEDGQISAIGSPIGKIAIGAPFGSRA